jgi:glycosyltransferase involved in cell wall biosynthesis
MKATLIVPTYNERDRLHGCLLSLKHQELDAADSFEVIVVDDGSVDGTGALVGHLRLDYDLRYLHKPRTERSCRSAARNLGLQHARGEVVIMVDGDQIIAPRFVAEHIRCHRDRPDLVVIGYRHYLAPGPVDLVSLAESFGLAALPPVAEHDERELVMAVFSENLSNLASDWHFFYGCNVSVRREHLQAVGGFDEGFQWWGFEDVELGYRLKARGLTFAYQRYAELYHQFQRRSVEAQYGEWLRSFAYFKAKHPVPEVAAQGVLERYFNPFAQRATWLDCYLRFEYAVRALQGRLPLHLTYKLVRVDDENVSRARSELADWISGRDCLVIDETAETDIPILVQTLPSSGELLYFKQPAPVQVEKIINRYEIAEPVDLLAS